MSGAVPSERASVSPRASKTIAVPPISPASAAVTPSSPCSESTIRSSRSWAESARWSTAYCSLTRWENAFSVIAMNGVSYGTSKSGKPSSSAASRRPGGVSACAKPTPRPRPARSWPASRSTKARCAAGSVRFIPVVSSSSPPDSQGVGSASSEMWTQRTARSSPSSPATSRMSRSRMRSRSASTYNPSLREASSRTGRSTVRISSNCSGPAISGGASWTTGSPRSSARQIRPRAKTSADM